MVHFPAHCCYLMTAQTVAFTSSSVGCSLLTTQLSNVTKLEKPSAPNASLIRNHTDGSSSRPDDSSEAVSLFLRKPAFLKQFLTTLLVNSWLYDPHSGGPPRQFKAAYKVAVRAASSACREPNTWPAYHAARHLGGRPEGRVIRLPPKRHSTCLAGGWP